MGNAGAVLSGFAIFKNESVKRTDEGYIVLGITVIFLSFLQLGIYFPDAGGLFFKAGSLSYDPQRIKPPADYKGSDVDFSSKVSKDAMTKGGPQIVPEVQSSTTA